MNYKGYLYTLLLSGGCVIAPELNAQETFSTHLQEHHIEVIHTAGSPLRMTMLLTDTRRLNETKSWFATYGAYLLGEATATPELEAYILRNPISQQAQTARIARATQYLQMGEYDRARHTLEQVREQRLTRQLRNEWQVKLAYALLMSGRTPAQVESLFEMTASGDDYWSHVARIYLSQIYIAQGALDKAEQTLTPIQDQGSMQYEARLVLARIALYRQDYQSVLYHTEGLSTTSLSERQRTESQILAGNAWYRLEEPDEAIARLAPLASEPTVLLTPEDQLILAAAYMETERTAQAIPHLLLATRGDAETSGVANLYLARARRDMGLYSEALASYQIATDATVDPAIREAAMYEQVLLLRSRASSSFGQEVRLCESFINTFDRSVHREAMEHFLLESYYRSPDYLTSLASIERIESPSPTIIEAQSFLLNQLTQQAQLATDLPLALQYNQQALRLETTSAHHLESLLLSAQLASQQGKHQQATKTLQSLLTDRTLSKEQSHLARYLLGYSQLKLEQYASATQTFSILLQGKRLSTPLQADAYARLGDAHYMQGHYTPAVSYYQEAYKIAPESQVYALYMLSDIEGLQKAYNAQIATLDKLIARHPNSLYKPQAMYDQGRAMELAGLPLEAIAAFTRLTQEHPQSEYGRKAALQLGLLYYNRNESSQAIETYKALLAEAPQSGEAKQAYEALKSIYIEEGHSTDFVQYANSIGGRYAINESEAMSISFETAERAYHARDPQAERLLQEYLALGPQGASALLAHYYLADLYTQDDRDQEALALYQQIYPDRTQLSQEYHIALLERMSAIQISQGAYQDALALQQELLTQPLDHTSYQSTLLASTETAIQAEQYSWVIETVAPLLSQSQDWSQEQLDLLTYRLAFSHLKSGQNDLIESLLKPLVSRLETRPATQGTLLLAQYYIAHDLQHSYSKQLLDRLVSDAYPDPDLSAETIITLSDWYLHQGDPDTARLYLESLLKNYTDDTSLIRQKAQGKLAQIRQLSKQ